MGVTWLADAEPDTSWAHHAWTDFAALAQREYAVVVLPVHGFARRGPGRPADREEAAGGPLLRRAVEQVKSRFAVRVLPPLRFLPAASPGGLFGLDPETAHDLVGEIAAGVKAAGFRKLVFFNTSPVSEAFVATAALDARAGLGLRTYVVHARALGFDPDRENDGEIASRAGHLAGLLTEIRRHRAPPLSSSAPEAPATPASPPAVFPGYRSRYLPALSPEELGAHSAKNPLVIVAIAAIEQHGPHLPVGVDAILGQALLAAALSRLPPDLSVLVAPPVTYGKSTEHQGFPGTISISTRTLRRLALALAGQLQDLSIRRLAFLNTHGGNSLVLSSTVRELQETSGFEAILLRRGHQPELGAQEAAWGFHAGEWETSLMLACAPDLVRMDRAGCEYPARLDDPGDLRPEHAPATFAWMTDDISHRGVMGDPTSATADKGRRWLAGAGEALAAKIREALSD